MKKGILMTLPRSDNVTEYLSVFSRSIITLCDKNSVAIKTINDEKVIKKNFEKMLSVLDYKMLIFNGHGGPDCILGHKESVLIRLGENEKNLKKRITYARSCWAALQLGETLKDDNGCFIGYKIPFMFFFDITRNTNPIKDNIAKIFFDTSNRVPEGLIKGHTAEEANENSRKSMLKAINKTLRNKDKDSEAIAETLWNNYLGQVLIGNSNARL